MNISIKLKWNVNQRICDDFMLSTIKVVWIHSSSHYVIAQSWPFFYVRLENSFTSPVNYGIPLWCTLSQEKSRIVPVFNTCQVLLFLKRVLIETIHVIIINRVPSQLARRFLSS